jgi:hypothetical protein
MSFSNTKWWVFGICTILLITCKRDESEVRKIVNNEYVSDFDITSEKPLFELLPANETGIKFVNRLYTLPEFNFKNYAYIFNGGGVATGDINNDGLQDVVFSGNFSGCRLYLNQGDFKFKDITKSSGLMDSLGFRTGVNMVDINSDGYLDIYVCRGGLYEDSYRKNLLYINNKNNTFTEKAEEYGIADMSYSTQSYFFDMDLDGDLDLYLLNHPENSKESNNLHAVDIGNGKQKVLLSDNLDFVSDRLYQNNDGKFMDITAKAGILNEAFGLSAVVGDFNDDMLPDIYVCNDYVKPDYLYINQGNGKFEDKFEDFFEHTSFSSMGSDYADINNDGCLDLMTLDMFPEDNSRQKMHGTEYNFDKYLLTRKLNFAAQFIKNTLQISNCNGTFSDIGLLANIAHTDWSWSTLFADYDNDGLKDIFVTNGYRYSVSDNDFVRYTQDSIIKAVGVTNMDIFKLMNVTPVHKTKSYFYKNKGDLSFANVSNIWDSGPPEFSNGAAYVDLNNDGYLDLIANNIDSTPFIYKNIGKTNRDHHFVRFQLNAGKGPIVAGTKIELTDNSGNVQTQVYNPTRGYLSSVEHVLHFGLGKATGIKEVKVTWPDKKVELLSGITMDKLHVITRGTKLSDSKFLMNPNLYFEDISTLIDISHQENEFIDFKREPLLHRLYSAEGPALAVADLNEDGLDDLYVGGSVGNEGKLFIQKKSGGFQELKSDAFAKDKACEDTGAIFVDVNGDQRLDLIVVSGGNEYDKNAEQYQDRIYINKGDLKFEKSVGALPSIKSSGCAVAVGDVDGDGDKDIFVGGRINPGKFPTPPQSYLAININGKFTDATSSMAESLNTIGMVTSAVFSDLDNDKKDELIICGEWMPIKIFKNLNGKFIDQSSQFGFASQSGWWEKIVVEDLDGDGFKDIVAGNYGLNTHTKASTSQPITVHFKDYDGNSSLDAVICYHNGDDSYPLPMRDKLLDQIIALKKKFLRYRDYANVTIKDIFTPDQRRGEQVLSVTSLASKIFYNNAGKSFTEVTMPIPAQLSCIRSIVIDDLNNDNKKDIIIAGNFFNTDVLLGRQDASCGLVMTNQGARKFSVLSTAKSGFMAAGNVRHIVPVRSGDGKHIVVARNSDAFGLLRYKNIIAK